MAINPFIAPNNQVAQTPITLTNQNAPAPLAFGVQTPNQVTAPTPPPPLTFGGNNTGSTAATTPNLFSAPVTSPPSFRPTPAPDTTPPENPFSLEDTELFQQSSGVAGDMLAGQVPGFEEQANISREALKAGQAQRAAKQREALIAGGFKDTGRFLGSEIFTADLEGRERAAHERGLAAERGRLGTEAQTAGLTASGTLLDLLQGGHLTREEIESGETIAGLQIGSAERIAFAGLDVETWKVERTEALTRAGWSHEAAENEADRQATFRITEMNNALTREIEEGRITLEESKLVQDASQFADELSFRRWATEAGFSDNEAQRAWATNERIAEHAFLAGEATLDRQLQTEIEEGRITLAESELAQRIYEFDSQQDFETWALEEGWSQDAIARAWQSGENAADRAHDAQIQMLTNALAVRGMDLNALLSFSADMPPDQQAQFVNELAVGAGLTWTDDDPDSETFGQTFEGLRPLGPAAQAELDVADIDAQVTDIVEGTTRIPTGTTAADPLYQAVLGDARTPRGAGTFREQGEKAQFINLERLNAGDPIVMTAPDGSNRLYEFASKNLIGDGVRTTQYIVVDIETGDRYSVFAREDGATGTQLVREG